MTFIILMAIAYNNGITLNFSGGVRDPSLTPYGIIMTDAHYSHLYVHRNDSIIELVTTPGCGRYYTLSSDNTLVGYKTIFKNGLQASSIVDVRTGTQTILHTPCGHAGQVSFSNSGAIAYTIGNELVVKHQGSTRCYDLGRYANYTSISPDGSRVIYNDENDQLWVLVLSTGMQGCVPSEKSYGYCLPRWSPDSRCILYSRLDGFLYVYDTQRHTMYTLPQGFHARWSLDSEYIIYHRPETERYQITGSDLYLVKYDGSIVTRLTSSPPRFEIDARFYTEDSIVFCAGEENVIFIAYIHDSVIKTIQRIDIEDIVRDRTIQTVTGPAARDSIDVPYINQVYDTPDWFNGHWACAPSTALMAIAYYAKLPVWSCWCSAPYGHTSNYGRYICEHYQYREVNYTWQAQDPSGNWAMGGYGYMWAGSNRPYTHMVPYLNNHDIVSWRDDSPTFAETIAEVNAGYPYGMCVGLTASGHLVLAVGQVLTWHTLICNDPYGNKNTPGYPSYDGKYARYDWPGYNNGYENLNTVYWCTGMHGDWEPVSDTIVDDLQFNSGFYLHTEAPSSMEYWRDRLTGYNGHTWWTYTTVGTTQDTCSAVWTPSLPVNGDYEVFAFIPDASADATAARYQMFTADDSLVVAIINQSLYSDEWVSLGVYPFLAATAYTYLGDATGSQGQHIAFDAICWRYQGPGIHERALETYKPLVLSSNPVSNCITMKVMCSAPATYQCILYAVTGQRVMVKDIHMSATGTYQVNIDVSACASGVYIMAVTGQNIMYANKVVIIHD